MRDPATPTQPRRDEIEDVLRLVTDEAARWLASLDERPVRAAAAAAAEAHFGGPLPERGCGAVQALRELVTPGFADAVREIGSGLAAEAAP
jgi:hypothetical protein